MIIFPNPFKACAALGRAMWAFVTGKPMMAKAHVIDRRMRICDSCPKYHAETDQCAECTCFIGLKVQLATEECPLKKWQRDFRI
jgi:hypothetical protein